MLGRAGAIAGRLDAANGKTATGGVTDKPPSLRPTVPLGIPRAAAAPMGFESGRVPALRVDVGCVRKAPSPQGVASRLNGLAETAGALDAKNGRDAAPRSPFDRTGSRPTVCFKAVLSRPVLSHNGKGDGRDTAAPARPHPRAVPMDRVRRQTQGRLTPRGTLAPALPPERHSGRAM